MREREGERKRREMKVTRLNNFSCVFWIFTLQTFRLALVKYSNRIQVQESFENDFNNNNNNNNKIKRGLTISIE
jgi:hypothetical protein